MKTATIDEPADSGLKRAFWSVGLCGVVLSVGSFFVLDELRGSISVGFGAALAVFNFWMTAYLVRGFLAPAGIRLPWPLIATVKLVVVLGGVYLLLEREVLSVLPLAIGFGALPLGIVFGQTRARAISADKERS
jgi:hypothetical protein